MSLQGDLVRLAYEKPELRRELLACLLKAGALQATVDMDDFTARLEERLEEYAQSSLREADDIRAGGATPIEEVLSEAIGVLGPNHDAVRSLRGSPYDRDAMLGMMRALNDASSAAIAAEEYGSMDPIFSALGVLREYMDATSEDLPTTFEEALAKYDSSKEHILSNTRKYGERVLEQIVAAARRARGWSTGQIRIKPFVGSFSGEPEDNFQVWIGPGKYAPTFTAFTTKGKISMIEDKLEGGDLDFFRDADIQRDYFNLIAEIENPGSTSKPGKDLVLWTARPTRDRRLYLRSKSLPTNVFLTTDPARARGIARDLGGREVRDLWRVVINEMHLTQTLDAGRLKDYQVVSSEPAPVKRIDLMEEGEATRGRVSGQQTYYWSARDPGGVKPGFRVPPARTGSRFKAMEAIFERVRKRVAPGKPSRIGAIFVCPDRTGFCRPDQRGGGIYEVEVRGETFLTNASLWTEAIMNWERSRQTERDEEYAEGWAEDYWTHTGAVNPYDFSEVIVQGTVTVIRRVE
jgi:hypothetical protein